MEKRYQVFISSTFTDLKEERQAVLRAILELNHMPAGMELFPAADDAAWQLIRDVIDASDYYAVIVGGRYGSLDEEGVGYTEKEYDYAFQTKKPVIALLHEKPEGLPRDKTETEDAAWKRLQTFRSKIEKKHHCVYWKSADELKARVIVGLTTATKRHPAIGWVRADQVPSGSTLADVLALRNRVAELETAAKADALVPPPGTEDFEHGDDTFEIHVTFKAQETAYEWEDLSGTFALTWDDIFAGVAPTMINEASHSDLRSAFRSHFERRSREILGNNKKLKGRATRSYSFRADETETCIVQFRSLGLIRESIKQRSVKDTDTYWRLTPYGDHLMTQLRAIRRSPEAYEEGEREGEDAEEV